MASETSDATMGEEETTSDPSTTSAPGDGDGDESTTSTTTSSDSGGDGDGDSGTTSTTTSSTSGGDGDGDSGDTTTSTTSSTSGGTGMCGDNILDAGEECDGSDLGGATCNGEGFAGGTLGCSACVLDTSACRDHYFQGFENGMPQGEYTVGGNGNWTMVTTMPYMGSNCAASPANTADSQEYWAELTLTYDVPGTISFARRTSTELTYDDLRFYIDGGLQEEWNGTNAWAMTQDYAVGAGTHTFRFTYYKDISLSGGSDRVWIDDITAVNGYVP